MARDPVSSLSVRCILVSSDDEVLRLPAVRFERMLSRTPHDALPQFAGQRVRMAEVLVELKDKKPVRVVRTYSYYVHFDQRGRLDYERFMKDGLTTFEAETPYVSSQSRGSKVIEANQRFAVRRRDHTVWWHPSSGLRESIVDVALGQKPSRRPQAR